MSANNKQEPLEAKAVIELPLDACYAFFLDYRNLVDVTEWIYSVSLKDSEAVEEGVTFVEKRNVRNNEMINNLVLSDIVINQSFRHTTALPKMTFIYDYSFEAVDESSTRVEVNTQVIGKGFSRFTAPVMEKEIKKETARILKDVRYHFGEEE